jgi:hypothetical protein
LPNLLKIAASLGRKFWYVIKSAKEITSKAVPRPACRQAGGGRMKGWIAGTLALLAVGSGCISLNKGSDKVAAVDTGKASPEAQASSAHPASLSADSTAAAPSKGDRQRDGAHRDADLTAEVSVTALPPGPDLQSQQSATRLVRANPPEASRPQPPAPAVEQTPAVAAPKSSEPPLAAPAISAAPVSGAPKLPTIVNGSVEPAAAEPPPARPTAATVRMVNSKRLNLNYEIKDVGPSGVSRVELWYTQDGKKWEKYDTANQPRPPFVVELKDEGYYGFTLVARNGVGLGKRPPRSGDQPQMWVLVDTTNPAVKLLDIQIGATGEGQHLDIRWKATDANLGQRPITLSYAEQAAGPWSVIATGVENTGSYAWQLPASVPPRILVRVEATDLMGNIGVAQLPEPIVLDLSQPSVSIVAVEPAGK